MTDDNMAVLALMQKTDDGDFLKSVAEAALPRIMDYDLENLIGAARLAGGDLEPAHKQINGAPQNDLGLRSS